VPVFRGRKVAFRGGQYDVLVLDALGIMLKVLRGMVLAENLMCCHIKEWNGIPGQIM
jgi:hypothetical protein